MTQKHKSEHGEIEFRLPTIPEALGLWGRMGVSPDDLQDKDSFIHNQFTLLSKMIGSMAPLVVRVDYTFGEVKVTDFETLCTHMEAMADLCHVAGRIMEAMQGGAEAKKK